MTESGPSVDQESIQPPPRVVADLDKRVRLMEQARSFGLGLMNDIDTALGKLQQTADDVDNWCRTANDLIRSCQNQSLSVGICGETGLGKSTLINALLDRTVAPTSSVEACTAAICVFAYNLEDASEKTFRARITFKSAKTIHQELKTFLEDVWDVADIHPEDIDADVALRIEANDQNTKVIAGWFGLTEKEILNAKNAEEIVKKSEHRLFKARKLKPEANFQEEINARTPADFRKMLIPFVQGKIRGNIDWPLVEIVEVFVKSDILEHGIKLVDLPGAMDALESRCEASRRYIWNLNKRIVAVRANRATDSKTAMDLIMSSTDMMDMHFDSQAGQDSLAIAVTQTDDMNIANAEEEWAEDDPIVAQLCSDSEGKDNVISDLNDQIQEVQDDIAELRGSEEEPFGGGPASVPQKRGRRDEYHSQSEDFKRLENKLRHLKKHRDTITTRRQQMETQILRQCILARNRRIIDNFDRNSMQSQYAPDLGPGNVFPNSARCYSRFKEKSECPEFQDRESTGVDALRRWINQVSLPHREEAARGHLQQLNILFDAADGWTRYLSDEVYNCHLSNEVGINTSRKLALQVDAMNKEVLKAMDTAIASLSSMKTLRDFSGTTVKSEDGRVQELDIALANFKKSVKSSGMVKVEGRKRMPWTTYRKCLRLRGADWKSSSKRSKKSGVYRWMSSIYRAFWDPFVDRWQAMRQRFSTIKSQLIFDVRKHFDAFAAQLPRDKEYPRDFRKILKQEVYTLSHEMEAFVTYIHDEFEFYDIILRVNRSTTKETFERRMDPAFEKAVQEKGKGSFMKQLNIMTDHVEFLNPGMFKDTLENMETKISNDKLKMMNNIKKRWNSRAKAKMSRNLERIVASVCPSIQVNISDKSDFGNTVVKNPAMKKAIRQAINEWRELWAVVEPQLPIPQAVMIMQHDEELKKQPAQTAKADRRKERAGLALASIGSKKSSQGNKRNNHRLVGGEVKEETEL